MDGWQSISMLTGAAFAMMALSGCGSSHKKYTPRDTSFEDQYKYSQTYVSDHNSSRELAVEDDLGASILHDHSGRAMPVSRERQTKQVGAALTHLDSLNVNIKDRTEDAKLILSDGWTGPAVGKYFAAPTKEEALGDYYADFTDELYPSNPNGVMAVQSPDERFDKESDASIYAGTILHEAVHNQVAQLPRSTRRDLHECFRDIGTADYRKESWQDAEALPTWKQGWMSQYASKNVHEDVASTTTMLLNERTDHAESVAGANRIPYSWIHSLTSTGERRAGWRRIKSKARCLYQNDILFEAEYDHVMEAFDTERVKPDRLGYDTEDVDVFDAVQSVADHYGL